jgi:hypothetical protein
VKSRFERTLFSRENRYWLGIDLKADGHFLDIPASNMMVDYAEAYVIAAEQYELFMADQAAALDFNRRVPSA